MLSRAHGFDSLPRFPEGSVWRQDKRQVFWLSDCPTRRAFSALDVRSTRFVPMLRDSEPANGMQLRRFVPDYSGGSAVELHHASLFSAHLSMRTPFVGSAPRVRYRNVRSDGE
jgi:hypothetical protein